MSLLDYSFDETEGLDVRTAMQTAAAPTSIFDNSLKVPVRKLSGAFENCAKQQTNNQHMKVYLRVRPTSHRGESTVFVESESSISTFAPENSKRAQYTKQEERNYTFNRVFPAESEQSEVFDVVMAPMMDRFLNGGNCVLLAYGMTNAGKTHTIQGTSHDQGIFPRLVTKVMEKLADKTFDFKISMLEVYQEKIYDLLSVKKDNLSLRGSSNKFIEISKLSTHPVRSVHQVMQLLDTAATRRSKSNTLLNSGSSRSHAIYILTLQVNGVTSIFHVVDLAGAERSSRTKSTATQLKEANNINTSLMQLWRCLEGLRKRGSSGLELIPYRESKLTHILLPDIAKAGLEGVAMITCINPHNEDYDETISILSNASLAYKIKEIAEFRPPSALTLPPPSKSSSTSNTNNKRKWDEREGGSSSVGSAMHRTSSLGAADVLLNAVKRSASTSSIFSAASIAMGLSRPSSQTDDSGSRESTESFGSFEFSQDGDELPELKRMRMEIKALKESNKRLLTEQINREIEIRDEVSKEMEIRSNTLLSKIQELQNQVHEKTIEHSDVTRSCKKAKKMIIANANADATRQLAEAEEELERLKHRYDQDLDELRDINCLLEDELSESKFKIESLNKELAKLKSKQDKMSARSPLSPVKSDKNIIVHLSPGPFEANKKVSTSSAFDKSKEGKIPSDENALPNRGQSPIGKVVLDAEPVNSQNYFKQIRSQFSLRA